MGASTSSPSRETAVISATAAKVAAALGKLNASALFGKLELLENEIEGVVLTPAKEELYNAARARPFNHDMRGFPLVIVQTKNVSDVVKCINFVRDHGYGMKLCVCCGGHSAKCMIDDSFVVDLRMLNTLTIQDAETEHPSVSIGGGAYLEDADKALGPLGLGIVAGSYPQTGIGGWTLGGGFGWLSKMYGLGIDNLLEVEVVLATSEVVVANDNNEHAALIVGCRGGGGNFGIVTKFTFRAYRLPKFCHAGSKAFLTPTHGSALTVCKNADAVFAEAPLECSCLLLLPAGAPVVPTMWAHFDNQPDTDVSACLGQCTLSLLVPNRHIVRQFQFWRKAPSSVAGLLLRILSKLFHTTMIYSAQLPT
jgi:FAD/FMN-containing dehydrogenase